MLTDAEVHCYVTFKQVKILTQEKCCLVPRRLSLSLAVKVVGVQGKREG